MLWPDHCVQSTRGAAIHPALDIPHAALIVRKGMHSAIDSYSTFFENDRKTPTGLIGYLRERGLTRLFLAGLAFDFCVRYSAEDAPPPGLRRVRHRGCLPRHQPRRLNSGNAHKSCRDRRALH